MVVVNARCVFFFAFLPSVRSVQQRPLPAHIRWRSGSRKAISSRPRTVPGGREAPHVHLGYVFQAFDAAFRGKGYPMALGQRVELTGMQAEVTALTDDGRPS